jgi:hypothetical protein
MRFDLEYYFRVHVPLARRHAPQTPEILKIEVESGTTLLLDGDRRLAPCVFCLYFRDRADVEAFRRFLTGPGTEAMRRDVPNYTNCELEWSVCEVRDC